MSVVSARFKSNSQSVSQKLTDPRRKTRKVRGSSKRLHGDGSLSEMDRESLVIEYRLKAQKLSRSILRKWHARLDNQEVDSIVDLSLCEAVRRYNPDKGASFMTFMFFHLRGNLIRAVAGAVQAQAFPAFDDEVDSFSPQSEISGHTHAKSGVKGPNLSDVTMALYGNDDLMPDDALEKKQLAHLSRRACELLDPLEQEVIHRLFFREQQLLDIADALGYSRCHISRVKKKALQVLRDELEGVVVANKAAGPVVQQTPKAFVPVQNSSPRSPRHKERRVTRRRRQRAKKVNTALAAASC
jgi:RNA polymerase sigma factor (sigma-70 family)